MDAIERLLADAESEMAALALEETRAEAAELRRAEEATIGLARRIMAARGKEVCVETFGQEPLWFTVLDCSEQWILGRKQEGAGSGRGAEVLVPLRAVVGIRGLDPLGVGDFSGIVARKLSLGAALRAFSDRHSKVDVLAGTRRYSGKVAKVGADFVDVCGEGGWVCVCLASIDRIEARGF